MRGGAEAGDRRRTAALRQKLAGEGVLELQCTIRDAVWIGRKRRMTRSSPGGCGRRWDTGEDVRQKGADGRPGTRQGGGCGLGLVFLDAGCRPGDHVSAKGKRRG
jgi:hypothetical protein